MKTCYTFSPILQFTCITAWPVIKGSFCNNCDNNAQIIDLFILIVVRTTRVVLRECCVKSLCTWLVILPSYSYILNANNKSLSVLTRINSVRTSVVAQGTRLRYWWKSKTLFKLHEIVCFGKQKTFQSSDFHKSDWAVETIRIWHTYTAICWNQDWFFFFYYFHIYHVFTVNSVATVERTVNETKKRYHDAQSSIKKKDATRRKELSKIGGSPLPDIPMKAWEKTVVYILLIN